MTATKIACLVGCIVLSFFVIYMLAGALMAGLAATTIGQLVLAAVSAFVGLLLGQFVYDRFLPGR
jgi:hypothetical protein